MKALLVALALASAPALAEPKEDLEFSELRYACMGEDAADMVGTRAEINAVCKQMDEELAQAVQSGLCWNEADASWHVKASETGICD